MNDMQERLKETRRLQQAQADILRLFIEICEEEGLLYYLGGGTLLGAIRHKGFIPWDDDVDVMMPREEYEKFLSVAQKHLPECYHLENARMTPGYHYYITRLTSDKMKVRQSLYAEAIIEDVSIDIFAIDGMPKTKFMRNLHMLRTLVLRTFYMFSVLDEYVSIENSHRTWYEKLLIWLCSHLHFQRLFSTDKRLVAFEKAIRKYPYKSSDYAACLMGGHKFKEIFPKEVFGSGVLCEFEGMKTLALTGYDQYLARFYGDYMTPPEHMELDQHKFEIIDSKEY